MILVFFALFLFGAETFWQLYYWTSFYLWNFLLNREKEDALKSDEKPTEKPTDGHQERENAPVTEESKDKEDAINETEEKEEDKVSFSLCPWILILLGGS